MRRRRLWTVVVVPIALSCRDATAPQMAKLRPELGGPSRSVVVGADAQFVSGGTCGAPSTNRATGVAIDADGRMAFNVEFSGSGTPFPGFACVNEGYNSIKLLAPPGSASRAAGMNDRRWIVGTIATDAIRAVAWRPDNTIQELSPALGDPPRSRATAMNNAGDIVGVAEDENGLSPRPFIAHIDLSMGAISYVEFLDGFARLGAVTLTPIAINDNRQIVGIYTKQTSTSTTTQAFLWQGGVVTDLASQITRPGVVIVAATDINNKGQIVGYNSDTQSRIPVMWENGHVTELPPVDRSLPQMDIAEAINDDGVIVGFGPGGALVWKDGQVSSFGQVRATGINGSNQVAGWGYDLNQQQVAIRWNRIAFNNSPVPEIVVSSQDVMEGTEVVFDASSTTDPEGDAIVEYDWDFGDGTTLTTTNPVARHTFTDNLSPLPDGTPDSYKVSLQVRDARGATATGTQAIVVRNAPPVPNAGPDRTVVFGEKVNVSVSVEDPGVYDGPWTVTYSLDGSDPSILQTDSKAGNRYSFTPGFKAAGTHRLTLVATDKDGGQGQTTLTITVVAPNNPPVANAGGTYTALEGVDVAFNGSGSSDPDGDAITYDWDFGDGTPHSTLQSPHHTYADDGIRIVTLVVTDPNGARATATTTATISNVAPTIAPFAGATLIAGETYTIAGSFADPGEDSWTATVDYGTGAGAQPLALTGKAFALANAYLVAGTYTVTVTVNDGDGGLTTASASVLVQSPSQAAQAATSTIATLVTAGALAPSEARTLNASLLAASATLARGNTTAGINQLQAFQSKVAAMLGSGRISMATAQALNEAAQRIIDQI